LEMEDGNDEPPANDESSLWLDGTGGPPGSACLVSRRCGARQVGRRGKRPRGGYNWQYTNVVVALEIDGTATGISGASAPVSHTDTDNVTGISTLSDKVKYLGTARGRLGWTPGDGWLLYATGGLAWESADRKEFDIAEDGSSFSQTTPGDHFGWVAGAGVETFVGSSNWIARLEYLHYDFDTTEGSIMSQTLSLPGTQAFFADKGGRQTIETVRAGLSYKFTP
jgi:opacity protein-like surface antigen